MKKLYLIDGMSVVFRAYHAMQRSGLKSAATGEPTFAVFAFINILTNLLEKEKPDHIAVAFDRSEPTFRHDMYPEYKANRDAFPDDLVPQLARIKQFIDLINIPRLENPGYEADDIIGTLAKQASAEGIEVACITNDKDYYQLIDDFIKIYKPSKSSDENFDIVSYEGVIDKFGVSPDKVIEVMALIGDSVDNIPGVKGIGEKTAIPLIQKYGSLSAIYENIDEIDKAAVKSKLLEFKDMGFLSRELVTIKIDVPMDISYDDIHPREPDYKNLDEFFKIVGFNTLRKKWAEKGLKTMFGEGSIIEEVQSEIIESDEGSIKNIEHDYIHVNSIDLLDKMIEELSGSGILSVDLETTGLDKMSCDIVGIALCATEGRAFYVSVFDDSGKPAVSSIIQNEYGNSDSLFSQFSEPHTSIDETTEIKFKDDLLPISVVLKKLKNLLENPSIGKIGQNIKFDASILARYGIDVSPIIFDSMIASYLLNSYDQHNLDALSKKWLNYTPISITTLIGEKKSTQISMKDVDPKLIAIYAAEDADLALKLRNKMYPELVKDNLLKLAEDIEFPLIEVLVRMERNGIAIDTKILAELSTQIDIDSKILTESIYRESGSVFNIDSPKQLAFVLFEKMNLPARTKTKTGYSTDVGVLTDLAPMFPIAQMVLDYRQLIKLQNTYIDALPKMINPVTGRIHTNYNQTIASTGRLSSTDPNLQNIPIRTELGKEIRKAFIPQGKGKVILSADYSQIELRIMAHYCNDTQLIEGFKKGLDIHSATASVLYDIPLESVNSDMRRIAKTVNFGIMYGLGAFGLSQRLGLGRRESQEIIDNYFGKYPGIKKYMDMTIKQAQKDGYAETLCGRKRFFPNINSQNRLLRTADERAAINLPIQGTASDMMKLAMLRVDQALRKNNFKSIMMLQVHDELVFEVFEDELVELRQMVKEEMESALSLGDVPVVVETGIGDNWLDAH